MTTPEAGSAGQGSDRDEVPILAPAAPGEFEPTGADPGSGAAFHPRDAFNPPEVFNPDGAFDPGGAFGADGAFGAGGTSEADSTADSGRGFEAGRVFEAGAADSHASAVGDFSLSGGFRGSSAGGGVAVVHHDAAERDVPDLGAPDRDTPPYGIPDHDSLGHDSVGHVGPGRDSPDWATPHRDYPDRQPSRLASPDRDFQDRDSSDRDTHDREPPDREAPGFGSRSVDLDTPTELPVVTPPPVVTPMPTQTWREVGFDTVERAFGTPYEIVPIRELGLRQDELDLIRQALGRRPTEAELAMYAVMWSEQASAKSSKVHLRQLVDRQLSERQPADREHVDPPAVPRAPAPRTPAESAPQDGAAPARVPGKDRLLAGANDNAAVIQVSERLAVALRLEPGHPGSIEESGRSAAVGIGAGVRGVLAKGARPVAVVSPLRFAPAEVTGDQDSTESQTDAFTQTNGHPPQRLLPTVVAGVGGFTNRLGLPVIGGETVFDECYQGRPLVHALCVGVLPVDRLQPRSAGGPGNIIILIGADTGRDGVDAVAALVSTAVDPAFDALTPVFNGGRVPGRSQAATPDPYLAKLLVETCLELFDTRLVAGVESVGTTGLAGALAEVCVAAGSGLAVNLDLVPRRTPTMTAQEILASVSPERMLLTVTPENVPVVLSICRRWGVHAAAIGEVTAAPASGSGGRLRIWWRGEVVVDAPPASLVDGAPGYARPMREPSDRVLMHTDRAETLPRPRTADQLRATLLRLLASPNLCDKSWLTGQFDRYVLGNTVLSAPEDAGVVRVDERTGLGVAISVDGNGRFARLDPYVGARLALAEAYRNVAVTGAAPAVMTCCLNVASPEDPTVMWQLAETARGLADGCRELGTAVAGGGVSFCESSDDTAIYPTPVVGVLGVLPNVADRVAMGFTTPGDPVYLLGETREELSGSEWAHVTHGHLGGTPPTVDFAAEQRLAEVLAEAARVGHLAAAHDLSEGGLAQALAESCLRRGMGVQVTLPAGISPFVALFSESAGRALVAVRRGQETAFVALAAEHGVPCTQLGVVGTPGGTLSVDALFDISLEELRAAHTRPRS